MINAFLNAGSYVSIAAFAIVGIFVVSFVISAVLTITGVM